MFPVFLEYLGKHATVFVFVAIMSFLICAFGILLFHLACHKFRIGEERRRRRRIDGQGNSVPARAAWKIP